MPYRTKSRIANGTLEVFCDHSGAVIYAKSDIPGTFISPEQTRDLIIYLIKHMGLKDLADEVP